MKILAVECSASPASAAILDDKKIIGSAYVNVKLTHSQTLLTMVENILSFSKTDLKDIEGFAISYGPGSFTGIRIGISAVKGLAASRNLPCVGVSTLFAMAQNHSDADCIVCAVMDARCNQVYNAIFEIKDGKILRLCEDRALMCDELSEKIKKVSQNSEKRVIIIGDGSEIFYPFVCDLPNVQLAAPQNRFQNAVGVGLSAVESFNSGNTVTPDKLLPFYLRPPQAERELKKKKGEIQ